MGKKFRSCRYGQIHVSSAGLGSGRILLPGWAAVGSFLAVMGKKSPVLVWSGLPSVTLPGQESSGRTPRRRGRGTFRTPPMPDWAWECLGSIAGPRVGGFTFFQLCWEWTFGTARRASPALVLPCDVLVACRLGAPAHCYGARMRACSREGHAPVHMSCRPAASCVGRRGMAALALFQQRARAADFAAVLTSRRRPRVGQSDDEGVAAGFVTHVAPRTPSASFEVATDSGSH